MFNLEQENTLEKVLQQMRTELSPIYGSGEAKAMIRLIFENLKNWNQVDLIVNGNKPVSPFILRQINKIMSRLSNHEPIQYILGECHFFGMKFKVSPAVLIPRPETEQLVDIIVDNEKDSDLDVMDLCSGSGCIAVALARNLPFANVTAVEISREALEIAAENAKSLKTSVNFIREDIFNFQPETDSLDIIVSNPPYIDKSEKCGMEPNVLDYEPPQALFVPNSDPLVFYRRIANIGISSLKPGGRLYLEINPRHASELRQMLQNRGFENVEIIKDIHAKERFAKCESPIRK